MSVPAPPAAKKPVVPPMPGDDSEPDAIDDQVLQAAIDVTDALEADDPDGAAAVRMLCMAVATELDLSDLVPDSWNTDGTVGDSDEPDPEAGDPPSPPLPPRK